MDPSNTSELIRRLENLLRFGTIDQVDVIGAVVRVRCGALRSSWLPWFSRRAGDVRDWCPPSVGEQCLLIAPGGDPANGMVLVGAFSEKHPPNDDRAHTDATQYPDGTLREYDHALHRLLMRCVGDIMSRAQGDIVAEAGGQQVIKASQSVLIEAGTSITLRVGLASLSISADGMTGTTDLVVDGVSVTRHLHAGVRRGADTSGAPTR